jgi:hypothetical protein
VASSPRHLAGDLFDFAGVAVAHHAIGGHRLGRLGQQQVLLGGAPAAAGAGLGVDHDPARLHQALLEEGEQPQQGCGWKAARGGHQPGGRDGVGVPLRQPIHGLGTELGICSPQFAGFGGIHLLPAAQAAVAVVGREVHHPHAALQQGGHQLGRQAIGQAEHREVGGGGDRIRLGHLHHRVVRQGQKGGEFTPALAAAALPTQEGHPQVGVSLEQAQGLQAPVATGADHGDALTGEGAGHGPCSHVLGFIKDD